MQVLSAESAVQSLRRYKQGNREFSPLCNNDAGTHFCKKLKIVRIYHFLAFSD